MARFSDWIRHPVRTLINTIAGPPILPEEPVQPPPMAEPPVETQFPPPGFGEPAPWFGNELTLYDDYGEPHSLTLQQWLDVAKYPKEDAIELYGLHPLSIMHMLDDEGLIDSEDWDAWRDSYEAMAG